MHPRNVASSGLCLALLAALPGCGGSKLDGNSLEREITEGLGGRGYADVRVQCPDVDNEPGERFSCDVAGIDGVTRFEGEVGEKESFRGVGPSAGFR